MKTLLVASELLVKHRIQYVLLNHCSPRWIQACPYEKEHRRKDASNEDMRTQDSRQSLDFSFPDSALQKRWVQPPWSRGASCRPANPPDTSGWNPCRSAGYRPQTRHSITVPPNSVLPGMTAAARKWQACNMFCFPKISQIGTRFTSCTRVRPTVSAEAAQQPSSSRQFQASQASRKLQQASPRHVSHLDAPHTKLD